MQQTTCDADRRIIIWSLFTPAEDFLFFPFSLFRFPPLNSLQMSKKCWHELVTHKWKILF